MYISVLPISRTVSKPAKWRHQIEQIKWSKVTSIQAVLHQRMQSCTIWFRSTLPAFLYILRQRISWTRYLYRRSSVGCEDSIIILLEKLSSSSHVIYTAIHLPIRTCFLHGTSRGISRLSIQYSAKRRVEKILLPQKFSSNSNSATEVDDNSIHMLL